MTATLVLERGTLLGLFGIQLAAGMVIFLPWLEVVGRGFARLMNGFALLFVLAIGWTQLQAPEASIALTAPGALAALGLIGLAAALLLQQGGLAVEVVWLQRATTWLAAVVALVAAGLYFRLFLAGGPAWHDGLRLAGMFTSLGVLGAVMTAMILGHWYLVNFNLAIAPFRLMGAILIGALVARLLVTGVALPAAPALMASVAPELTLTRFCLNHVIELPIRVLFGQLVPLAFACMTLHVIGLRNKQAATGLLYATIVPLLIGEAIAGFLLVVTKVPV